MKTDISIIILNFNRSTFLERSIRSCVDQIIFNKTVEIVIVDDGSTDDSHKILNNMKSNNNIKVFKNKKNMGIGYSSNFALKKAKGDYIIRVDSDDFLNKHAVQVMSGILDFNKEISMVYCDHYRVDVEGHKEELVRLNTLSKIKNHGAGILFRKKHIIKVGGYNKNLKEAEDYELISKLKKKKYKSFYLPIPLYRYYIHKNNISASGNRFKEILKIKAMHNVL
tara:strand:+ start:13 stop:684 length:672 start_codon:yes stop_codon:yes gene_type:complete